MPDAPSDADVDDGGGGDGDEDALSSPPWVWEVEVDFGVQEIVSTPDGFVVAGETRPNQDAHVAWLDREGRVLRDAVVVTERWGSDGISYQPVRLAVSDSGEAAVLARLQGNVDLDPGPGVDERSGYGTFLLVLDAGGAYRWARAFFDVGGETSPGPGVTPAGLAMSADGDVVVGGRYQDGADLDPGPGVDVREATGPGSDNCNAFVLRLSREGEYLWARTFGSGSCLGSTTGADSAAGLAATRDGTLLVTGALVQPVDLDPGDGEDWWGGEPYNVGRPFVTELTADGDYVRGWFARSAVGELPVPFDRDAAGGVQVVEAEGRSAAVAGGAYSGPALFAAVVDSDGTVRWSWALRSWVGQGTHIAAVADGSFVVGGTGSHGGPEDFDPGPGEDIRDLDGPGAFLLHVLPDGSSLGVTTWPAQFWYTSTPLAITDDGLAVVAWAPPGDAPGPTHVAAIRLEDIGR